ncbi:hypothetical protein ACFL53_00060 [Pseudomonadota bacterium]
MGQKSGQRVIQPRVPDAFLGIDVNKCSIPSCENFAIPSTNHRSDPHYKISGNKKNGSSLQCKKCFHFHSVKSNKAIFEEVERLSYLQERSTVYRQDGNACSNIGCANFGISVRCEDKLYKLNGKTSVGNQRYKCLSCGKTFVLDSGKRKNHPQNKSHLNTTLFRLLVNNMNINRCIEITELDPKTIYRKIDMFYERAVSFSATRESILKQMDLGLMRLASDRQEYHVNWSNRKDKKNVVMTAIGTADKASSYVFGMDVNYEPSISMQDVIEHEEYKRDAQLKDYNRHHARLWTERDYQAGKQAFTDYAKKHKELVQRYRSLPLPISEIGLSELEDRLALEYGIEPTEHSSTTKLPTVGSQVHSEYTMYAHFFHLSRLLGHANALRFYLDQEPAINRACNLAFSQSITQGRCHSLFVKINKELTVDQRRAMVNASEQLLEQVKTELGVSKEDARIAVAQGALNNPIKPSPNSLPWYELPLDKIYECEKHVAFLTDKSRLRIHSQSMILLDASLHPIDNFFQVVRRRLSLLERPISTTSNVGRVWTGKSPYNPHMISNLLQILRVYYNYCRKSPKDGKTPAERLGLAKGAVEIRKILYPSSS